jgi:asparagine synthase (glutamine-hydrolysing)
MRAIAGCLSLTGERLGPADLAAVATPAAGGDGSPLRVWHDDRAALGYAPGATVAAERAAGRPAVDPRSGCVAVLLGVVHDWGSGGPAPGEPDDAEGLLALHAGGGAGALEGLTGDFAAALWDPRELALHVLRDPVGGVGLVHTTVAGRLRFATTTEQLVPDPADAEPDEDSVAWMLYGFGGELSNRTFFAGVSRLRAGHRLEAREGRVSVRRYHHWPRTPPPERPLRDEDVERFRAAFREAARCRLGPEGTTGILISGGVDSSSVACAAALAARAQGQEPPALYTASFERHPGLDESRYSAAVAEHHRLRRVAEPGDDGWTLSNLERWLPACHEPLFPAFNAITEPAIARAREDGVGVLLWGHGGDTLVAGSTRHLATLLARGRWRELAREGRAEAGDAEVAARFLAGATILPLLPGGLQSYALRRHEPWSSSWVGAGLADRARAALRIPLRRGPDAWWHELRDIYTSGTDGPGSGSIDRRGRFEGVEYRAPFFDRRVVDLVLRLPSAALRHRGSSKVILRRAMGADLPDLVRRRRDKTHLTVLLDEGLREQRAPLIRELVRDSELARRDWVAEEPWRDAVQRYLAGDDGPRAALWTSITLELWLRRRARRSPV